MTMPNSHSLKDCRYRSNWRARNGVERAECRLLQEISGVADGSLCEVGRDACEYCSRTGEPSVYQINPVLGSILYELGAEVVRQGGVAGCDADRAERLRRWAEEFLDAEPNEVDRPHLPSRITSPCYYLGEEIGFRLNGGDDPLERVPVLACRHPAHQETTAAECARCRDWSDRPNPETDPIEAWLPIPVTRTGRKVRQWSVGVTTAPRRRASLEWTLESLARAGWESARLFVDSTVTIPKRFAGYPITYREPKVGAWPNFYLGLAELLLRDPDADAYFMVQDDVAFHDRINLREYLEDFLWPGDPPGPVSLYASEHDVRPEFGWHAHSAPWFRGALAFLFPPTVARQLLIDPMVFNHRFRSDGEGLLHVDTVIGEWSHRNRIPIHLPTPSLCRHLGHSSSLMPEAKAEGHRKEGTFAGELSRRARSALAIDEFPESQFPCPEPRAQEYRETVARGRARMREHSVTICGICRDVAAGLPAVAARIERLGRMFGSYHGVFYENDSTDGTAAVLRSWAEANPAIRVFSERHHHPRFGQVRTRARTSLLALYRNRCREQVLAEFSDDDHVIVVDMDLEGGWSYDGIAHTFGSDGWDFVGSSGLAPWPSGPDGETAPVQLDSWAYRIPGREEALPGPQVRKIPLRRGDPLHPVWSCFGGLGVYRMECQKAASYGGDDCEHVVLHRDLRERGFDRLFLNPNQIVVYKPWY